MKKVLGGLLVATAVVSLAACSGGKRKLAQMSQLRIGMN